MAVRPARPGDAEQIARVHVQTWQQAYLHVFGRERLAELDVERRRPLWERQLAARAPRTAVLVHEREGAVAGFASVGPSRGEDTAETTGELYAIYVLPRWWGASLGRELMAASVEALREHGFREAVLWVLEDNPRARRFYEREGWAPDGARREEEFLGVDVTEVRYRRSLPTASSRLR